MKQILYISYDGVCEPLGISQIISYLEILSKDYKIYLISFEKNKELKNKINLLETKKRLSRAKIKWIPIKYHNKFKLISKPYDILNGLMQSSFIILNSNIDIIHTRSYIPALIALPLKILFNKKLLFDIRGFWPEERIDGGLWKSGSIYYRILKILEIILFKNSNHIVTLTEASLPIINNFHFLKESRPGISVIPTCTNLNKFRIKNTYHEHSTFTFGYVGSFGTWYLLDETIKLFKEISLLKPEAKMLILNRNEHQKIIKSAKLANIDLNKISIYKVDHKEVPLYIQKMNAAASLIKPCFSKLSSSPTKLGEYLGCGIPCVGNVGVGDVENILAYKNTGVILKDFNHKEIHMAAKNIIELSKDKNISKKCRETALKYFSLEKGVNKYRRIYENL